jgi:hypothetical protein
LILGFRILPILFFAFILYLFTSTTVHAQYKIRGKVFDSTRTYPVAFVSVLSTSGRGTATNADGQYEIEVSEKDSIWFSYLNKPTIKFPVLKIATPLNFDISIQVNVTVLKEVKIRPRNYRQDSLQNREDYAKVFNYRKPGLSVVTPQYGAAAGFDINEIINVFRFRRNKSMLSFQNRLLAQEEEKFVDHRFNKGLIRRLTHITRDNELDSFMQAYRPPYMFAVMTNDYDFQKYIKDSYELFKQGLQPRPMWKQDDEP